MTSVAMKRHPELKGNRRRKGRRIRMEGRSSEENWPHRVKRDKGDIVNLQAIPERGQILPWTVVCNARVGTRKVLYFRTDVSTSPRLHNCNSRRPAFSLKALIKYEMIISNGKGGKGWALA